jgi:hypothetical protein
MKLYVVYSWMTEELDDLGYLHLFDCKKFDFIRNINEANVIIQTNFNNFLDINTKKVLFVMEPDTPGMYGKYNVVVSTHTNYPDMSNVIYYPFFFFYLHSHKYLDYILNRRIYFNPENKKKFCIFINSNTRAWQRIDFAKRLMEYKQVDCYAGPLQNQPKFEARYWTHDFLNLIRQYKFMICFENSDVDGYITEKLANAYLGDTVPIYWGNSNATKFINKKAIVNLEVYNEENINRCLQEIISLDKDDSLYLDKIRKPLLIDNKVPEEFQLHRMREKLNQKIF